VRVIERNGLQWRSHVTHTNEAGRIDMSIYARVAGVILVISICLMAYTNVSNNPLLYVESSAEERVGLVYVEHDSRLFVLPFCPDQLRRVDGRWYIVLDNGAKLKLAHYDDFTQDKIITYPGVLGANTVDPGGRNSRRTPQWTRANETRHWRLS
jgi:hypothetical protein